MMYVGHMWYQELEAGKYSNKQQLQILLHMYHIRKYFQAGGLIMNLVSNSQIHEINYNRQSWAPQK